MCSRVDLHITRSNTSNTFCSETRSLLRERGFTSFSVNRLWFQHDTSMTQATILTPRCYRLVRRIHAHQVWVDARRWAASHLWHKSDFVFQSSRHYLWRHSSTLFLYLTLFAHFRSLAEVFFNSTSAAPVVLFIFLHCCAFIFRSSSLPKCDFLVLFATSNVSLVVRSGCLSACRSWALKPNCLFTVSSALGFRNGYCSCALAALSNVKATLMRITES